VAARSRIFKAASCSHRGCPPGRRALQLPLDAAGPRGKQRSVAILPHRFIWHTL